MIDWIATALTLAGAAMVAASRSPRGQFRGFWLMLAGNAAWIAWAIAARPQLWSVVTVNLAFAVINVLGLYRRRRA